MKSVIHIIMIFLSISIYGCKSNNNEFEITDVQFKDNIYKPMYMNYDYGTPICNKQDLDEYRLKRLGQKVRVTYYDKSIRIEILDTNKSKEFILDYKGNNKYSGDGIDAVINETLSNNTIIININAQKELDVNLTIFKKYEEATSEAAQGWIESNEKYWLMTNKSIVITAKN
ncbi:hypothetical protein [Phocaeicola sartorii]|uniref:hypothetical protein n=1 Tax=Phocaeicola sartorii TaxID=671267 RepID=UPI001F58D524|nr:hypothetical protein [Phocaeicola sartorii]